MVIEFTTVLEQKKLEAQKELEMQKELKVQKKVAGSDIVTARLKSKCDCWGPWFHD